jgi:hypothetical protein
MRGMNGWLSPLGEFVDYEDERHCSGCHKEVSDDCNFNIFKCIIFNKGFIKLSEGKWYALHPAAITKEQAIYIKEYCEKKGDQVPAFIRKKYE